LDRSTGDDTDWELVVCDAFVAELFIDEIFIKVVSINEWFIELFFIEELTNDVFIDKLSFG